MSPRRVPPLLPDRPVRLLRRVVAGDEAAWRQLIEASAPFLYALAWRYARGEVDAAAELVLVAIEGLRRSDADGTPFYRLRRYLDSMRHYGGRSRFRTWLALVVKNLFRDHLRERDGRRLLPKEISGLDEIDQEIFRLLFWEGNSELEAFGRLRTSRGLDEAEFDLRLDRIRRHLSTRNLWTLYEELLRRQPPLALDSPPPGGAGRPLEVADPKLENRPDGALQQRELLGAAFRLGETLRQEIDRLPTQERRVLLLLVAHGLDGEEARRVLGFRQRQRVYDLLARAKRRLRIALVRAGVDREQVAEAIGWLDGFLEGEPWHRIPRVFH